MSQLTLPYPRIWPLFVASAGFVLALGLAFVDCGAGDNGACSWLLAPPGFVDAGAPGCTAEPAGQTCSRATDRCHDTCQAGEYLLTCRSALTTRFAIPEEVLLQDPVIDPGRPVRCNPVLLPDTAATNATTYCCQCAQ